MKVDGDQHVHRIPPSSEVGTAFIPTYWGGKFYLEIHRAGGAEIIIIALFSAVHQDSGLRVPQTSRVFSCTVNVLRSLTQMVVPALPALLAGPRPDSVVGDHVLLNKRPIFRAVLRHKPTYGIVICLCPRSPTAKEKSRKYVGPKRRIARSSFVSIENPHNSSVEQFVRL